MARKKILEEENSENAQNVHQHLGGGAVVNKSLLHDNTNVKLGHFQQSQQKLKINNSNTKVNNTQKLSKGHKNNSTNCDDKSEEEQFYTVGSQLALKGLVIREMPGDGNCLFHALADQLEGSPRNHLEHRRAVVDFIRKHRADFEPFVEDDETFDKHVHLLAQPGTFAGNDAIAAFARLHKVSVVIHQLNSPAWIIHPSSDESYPPIGREVHIAYHNGDHYNSVRRLGDNSDSPANVKISLYEGCSGKGEQKQLKSNISPRNSPPRAEPYCVKPHSNAPFSTVVSGDLEHAENNYENNMLLYGRRDEDFWVKDTSDIDRLVQEVMEQTDCNIDPNMIRETLMEYHFDMASTVDFILSMNFIMSQSQEEEQSRRVDEINASPEQIEPSNTNISQELNQPRSPSVNCTFVKEETNSQGASINPVDSVSDTLSSGPGHETENNVISPNEKSKQELLSQSSEKNESTTAVKQSSDSKSKMSSRQRKDLKKKERKREADLRKVKGKDNTSETIKGVSLKLEAISI